MKSIYLFLLQINFQEVFCLFLVKFCISAFLNYFIFIAGCIHSFSASRYTSSYSILSRCPHSCSFTSTNTSISPDSSTELGTPCFTDSFKDYSKVRFKVIHIIYKYLMQKNIKKNPFQLNSLFSSSAVGCRNITILMKQQKICRDNF